jgi:hypothetical protein
LTLLVAASPGCGKKGPPRPPPRLIPEQTTDLTVRQTGDRLVLEMTYPAATTGGLPLDGIEALEVLALRPPAGATAAADPRSFEVMATLAKRLEGPALIAATRGPRLIVELDTASLPAPRSRTEDAALAASPTGTPTSIPSPTPTSTPASAGAPTPAAAETPPAGPGAAVARPPAAPAGPPPLLFAVRTFGSRRNESPLSNMVGIVPQPAPPPPATLQAAAAADGVRLTWTTAAGAPAPAGFEVLRRAVGEDSSETRIAQVPPDRMEHLDATATFGETYAYTVRTVAARDPLVESDDGPGSELKYRDTFAPPVPSGLVALAEEGRVRLLWDRVESPDLAGYRLYRRENDGDQVELPREPGAANDHIDDRVRPGATYTYRVSAVDHEDNESAQSEPAVAIPR